MRELFYLIAYSSVPPNGGTGLKQTNMSGKRQTTAVAIKPHQKNAGSTQDDEQESQASFAKRSVNQAQAIMGKKRHKIGNEKKTRKQGAETEATEDRETVPGDGHFVHEVARGARGGVEAAHVDTQKKAWRSQRAREHESNKQRK